MNEATFVCMRCGNCCRVTGYVRLRDEDVDGLARCLKMTPTEFTSRYTRLTEDRRGLSLIEAPESSCIFLEPGGLCRVHAAKPRQCRDFPVQWNFPGYEAICKGGRIEDGYQGSER